MNNPIEIKLTEKQFNKLLQYAVIGNTIEYFNTEKEQRDNELMQVLLLTAKEVLPEIFEPNGGFSETFIRKTEIMLNAYEDHAFGQRIKDN